MCYEYKDLTEEEIKRLDETERPSQNWKTKK